MKTYKHITDRGKQLIEKYYNDVKKDAEKKQDKILADIQHEIDARCD